jgi:hypothetical protein
MRSAPAEFSTKRSVKVPPVSTAKRIGLSCNAALAVCGQAAGDGKIQRTPEPALHVFAAEAYHFFR